MTAMLLDGKGLAKRLNMKLKKKINDQLLDQRRAPCLVVILVGQNPASFVYVRAKQQACQHVGIDSQCIELSEDTTQATLISTIDALNRDTNIDGILIQRPLPKHLSTPEILERIVPEKDVDGFHPYNLGRLAQGNPALRPCTPYGIMHLLNHYGIASQGKHAVILGCSNIVGRPMALEFLLAKATVTVCHRDTTDIEHHVRRADILVVATGTQNVIDPAWLLPHQVVIDVGIHRLPEGSLRGDIDFQMASHRVAYITPVPGGVGPMTVSMLLHNTWLAYSSSHSNSSNSPS